MKINLSSDYFTYDNKSLPGQAKPCLWHKCNDLVDNPIYVDSEKCHGCLKLTPEIIMFAYKLWKWHNE